VVARGYYEDIKGRDGIKFQQLLYIAFYDDDKNLQIGCLKLTGAALGAWFDFKKVQRDVYDGAISIEGRGEKEKNGATVFYRPVFKHIAQVSEESEATAKQLDVHLQEYLTTYFANAGIEETEIEYTGGGNAEEVYTPEQSMAASAASGGVAVADDDDIPF
jgi:hypothetical protein